MLASTSDPALPFLQDPDGRLDDATQAPSRLQRVLHVINGQHYSGAERVQDLLALRLKSWGFDVGFASLTPGRFADARLAREATLIPLKMFSRLDLRPALELARIIRRDNYVLVHSHTPRAAMIGALAARLARVPLVHQIHSTTATHSTRARKVRVNHWIERVSLRNVSNVIVVSESLAAYAGTLRVPANRITVVPNGVPSGALPLDRLPPTSAWTLGIVSLFRPGKGLEVLLEALGLLRSQGINVRLRAAGDFETPEYRKRVMQLTMRLGVGDLVDWVGFAQDVPGELTKFDLFVLPSLYGEGLSLAILEAMAAGVPIVATRVEGIPEAIRDGIEGLIAHPNNPGDLARAIARYVRGQADWSRLRAAAHERQAERFSDEAMAEAVAEVYQRVLA